MDEALEGGTKVGKRLNPYPDQSLKCWWYL